MKEFSNKLTLDLFLDLAYSFTDGNSPGTVATPPPQVASVPESTRIQPSVSDMDEEQMVCYLMCVWLMPVYSLLQPLPPRSSKARHRWKRTVDH